MGKIKKEVKEAVKQIAEKTSDGRIYTTKIGPVDVGSGLSKSASPEGKEKPFMFLGKGDEEGNYGYARIGSGKDKQVGFGKTFNEGQGSLGVDVGKDFIGIGGSYNFKDGGEAKPGLWANINRRKKLGISRPKSKTTISKEAYANMKAGFPKKKMKKGGIARGCGKVLGDRKKVTKYY